MSRQLTTVLSVSLLLLLPVPLSLWAAPPTDKGGGKGGGGGETAVYTVTPLHFPNGISTPSGISAPDAEGVVAIIGDIDTNHAVLWDVDTAGKVLQSTTLSFNVHGVTSDGLVVGTEHRSWSADIGGGAYREVAVAWKDGALVDLPLVAGDEAIAYGVNSAWQVVGREAAYDPASGEQTLTGVYWELSANGVVTRAISTDDFLPLKITNTGIMVGRMRDPIVPAIATVDADGVVSVTSLGLPPDATAAYALDANDSLEIAGHCYTATANRAFRWSSENGYEDLGTLHKKSTYARGRGISPDGMVVGQSAATPSGGSYSDVHAFVWDGSGMLNLNDLISPEAGVDWLWEAGKINSAGQIICLGVDAATVEWRAYLLSPAP